ncbi:flavin reductase family protein [Streptomyces sp. NPDC097617]|uniref:flavin reductase family protein n=1 Tax=Streptomyces sp. NPDC097617 TaxID=3366091 RepID=UPI0038072E73
MEAGAFREAIGHFASGVVVITTLGPAGFTCQSLTSLSLGPPLISFAINRSSATWPRIAAAGVIGVNILDLGQEELARRFASPHTDRFAQTEWVPSPELGVPRLTGSTAWIEATIENVHPGGDHHIVVCRVRSAQKSEQAKQPLIYHKGRFGRLAHGPFVD